MKFELKNGEFYFMDEAKEYKVQSDDIERLSLRPGSRVLRFLDNKGKMVALPLTTAVGEVEGFVQMVEAWKKQNV